MLKESQANGVPLTGEEIAEAELCAAQETEQLELVAA